jgi:hypothetical protein
MKDYPTLHLVKCRICVLQSIYLQNLLKLKFRILDSEKDIVRRPKGKFKLDL